MINTSIDLHSGLQVLIAIVGDLMFQLLVGTCLVSHSCMCAFDSRFYLLDGWRDLMEILPLISWKFLLASKHLLEPCLGPSSKLRPL